MKHLFVTTALAAVLSLAQAPAQAQVTPPAAPAGDAAAPTAVMPSITPPEGFVESDVVLTSENLEGATVYDASGAEIGEVHGLVFANGTTSMQGMDKAAAPAPKPDTATEAATDTTTAATDAATISNVGSDPTAITPTEATTPPVQTVAEGEATKMDGAEVGHAIIDVGGFLGMGEHRVAVPVKDLVVYHYNDEIRIYLPWTKAQIEALPEFDENAPVPVVK